MVQHIWGSRIIVYEQELKRSHGVEVARMRSVLEKEGIAPRHIKRNMEYVSQNYWVQDYPQTRFQPLHVLQMQTYGAILVITTKDMQPLVYNYMQGKYIS